MPSPIRIGRPEMVTSDRSMPMQPEDREGPEHADRARRAAGAGASGPGTSQPSTIAITAERDQPERQHAALQVVVDLLEVDRRPGDGEVEVRRAGRCRARRGSPRWPADCASRSRLPSSTTPPTAVCLVGEGAGEREADLLVGGAAGDDLAVDDLVVVIAVDRAGRSSRGSAPAPPTAGSSFCSSLGTSPSRAKPTVMSALAPRRRPRRGRARRGALLDRGRRTSSCRRSSDIGEGERRRVGDDGRDVRRSPPSSAVSRRCSLEVGAEEQVGDVGAVLRLEQEDDRLPTELVLERHVVDRRSGSRGSGTCPVRSRTRLRVSPIPRPR